MFQVCGGRISARLACDTLESEYFGTSNQSSRLVSAPPKSLPFRSTLIDEPITNQYFTNTTTHGFRSAATPTLVGGNTRTLKPLKTSQNVSLGIPIHLRSLSVLLWPPRCAKLTTLPFPPRAHQAIPEWPHPRRGEEVRKSQPLKTSQNVSVGPPIHLRSLPVLLWPPRRAKLTTLPPPLGTHQGTAFRHSHTEGSEVRKSNPPPSCQMTRLAMPIHLASLAVLHWSPKCALVT